MIELSDHAEGVLLPVRAKPGARKAGIQGERNGALVVAVTAPPEDGRSNDALVELLHEQQHEQAEVKDLVFYLSVGGPRLLRHW